MGNCCQPKSKSSYPDPSRTSQTQSTFKEIASQKECSMIARQHQLYLLRENKLMIYDTDLEVAWIEDISMRGRVNGDYLSVKTGPNELFVIQHSYAVLIDVPLRTGVDKAPPPVPITHCSLAYYNRKVYAPSTRLFTLDLPSNSWSELFLPTNYPVDPGSIFLEGNLYLFGGVINGQVVDTVLIYSLAANSWVVATARLPLPMKLPCCLSVADEEVVITSGKSLHNEDITDAFLFDLYNFHRIAGMDKMFDRGVVMGIGYRRRGFVVRGDGVVSVYRRKEWSELNMEKIADELLNVDTEASVDEELERKRAKIPKKSCRPERLYAYTAQFDEENCFIAELNTVSLESRQIDLSPFTQRPLPGSGMCLLPQSVLLIAGGLCEESEIRQSLLYDCSTPSFRSVSDLQRPQAYLAMVLLLDHVYALGTVSKKMPQFHHRIPIDSYFQRYWVSEERWETLQPPLVPLLYSSMCNLAANLYAFAGIAMVTQEIVDYTPGIQVYYSVENQWKRIECKYPVIAGRPQVVNTLQNRVLCFGGGRLTSESCVTEAFSFDGKTFRDRGEVTFQGELSCAVVSKDGNRIFAVDLRGLFRIFDLAKGRWEEEIEEMKVSVF